MCNVAEFLKKKSFYTTQREKNSESVMLRFEHFFRMFFIVFLV